MALAIKLVLYLRNTKDEYMFKSEIIRKILIAKLADEIVELQSTLHIDAAKDIFNEKMLFVLKQTWQQISKSVPEAMRIEKFKDVLKEQMHLPINNFLLNALDRKKLIIFLGDLIGDQYDKAYWDKELNKIYWSGIRK